MSPKAPRPALGIQDELGLTTGKLGEKHGKNVLVLQLFTATWSVAGEI